MNWEQALILMLASFIGSCFGLYWQYLMATVPLTSKQIQIGVIMAIIAAVAYVVKSTLGPVVTWMDLAQTFLASGMALIVTTSTPVLKTAAAARRALAASRKTPPVVPPVDTNNLKPA